MKKILSVAAMSSLVVTGVMIAAGMGQPGAGGQPGQPGTMQPGGGGGRGGQPGGGGGGRGQAPGLDGSMKGMERSIDALKTSISDASKKEDNLRLLGDAERFCAGAKNAKPTDAMNDAKDDAAKAKMLTEFRMHLINVLKGLIDAEVATMDGKTTEAKAALDKVIALRDTAHKEFNVKEKGPGDAPPAPRGGGAGK